MAPSIFLSSFTKKRGGKREKGQYKRWQILFHLNKHLEHNDFKCNFKIWIAFDKSQVVFKISEEYKDQPIQETYKKGQRRVQPWGIRHCCTGILQFIRCPGTFEIRIAFKNRKEHVINKMIKQIIVISKIFVIRLFRANPYRPEGSYALDENKQS